MTEKSKILAKFHRLVIDSKPKKQQSFGTVSQPELLETLFSLELSHSSRQTLVKLHLHGKINQRKLAQILDISPQAVSETVKKLLSLSCITRENGSQKNENILALTPLGENIARLLEEVIQNHAEHFFQGFSQEELEQFSFLMDKLLENQKEKST